MAKELNMNEHQIYKWFWETNNKNLNVEKETIDIIKNIPDMVVNALSDYQKFEIFAKKALR